jgi:GT2 family glycosyltransferase
VLAQDEEHAVPNGTPLVDCAVVVVTYNSGRHVSALLDSLRDAADGLTLRTIVVDNGSADDTLDQVRRHTGVVLVETGANLGYAGAINVGRARARPCRSILVLNPDLRLEPGAIRMLLDAAGSSGGGVTVPCLVDVDGNRHRSLRRDPTLLRALGEALCGDRLPGRPPWASELVREPDAYRYRHRVDWATGAAVLVTDDCDRAVGAWDESFFLYSEEVDHAIRARRAGYAVEYVPGAVAVHDGAGSGSSDDLVALMAVNRVRHHRKHHGPGASGAYRAAMVVHALLRLGAPGQRAALAALVGRPRSAWLRSVLDHGRPDAGAARPAAEPQESGT